MQALRDELLETQKARSNLARWKLLAIAATAVAAFGVGDIELVVDGTEIDRTIILGFTAVVCTYIDWLYFHLAWRIKEIGHFFRSYDVAKYPTDWKFMRDYEEGVNDSPKLLEKGHPEARAVTWTTYWILIAITVLSIVRLTANLANWVNYANISLCAFAAWHTWKIKHAYDQRLPKLYKFKW